VVGGASSPRGLFLPEVKLGDRRWVGGWVARNASEEKGRKVMEKDIQKEVTYTVHCSERLIQKSHRVVW
jgi:hypothetical protein